MINTNLSMESILAILDRWAIASATRLNIYRAAIQIVCPGAADATAFTPYQMYELLHELKIAHPVNIDTCMQLLKEICKNERNDKKCAHLHKITVTLTASNTAANVVMSTSADTSDVENDNRSVPDDCTPQLSYSTVVKTLGEWHDANYNAIHSWRATCTQYKYGEPIMCRYLAAHGMLDMLSNALIAGYAMDDDLCELAITAGHLNVVKWLKEHDYVDKTAQSIAAKHGNLEILKYLINAEDCVYDDVFDQIAATGQLELLQMIMIKQRVNWDMIKKVATKNNQTELLTWIARMVI